MDDANREVRSMVMTAFPCPPLPQIVVQCSTTNLVTASSHDTIAHGLNIACTVYNSAVNNQRRETQHKLQQEYNKSIDILWEMNRDMLCDPNSDDAKRNICTHMLYDVMQKYTRQYIATILPSAGEDIRFFPYDDIDVGSPIHRQTVDHMMGQMVISGVVGKSRNELSQMSYRDLLLYFFRYYASLSDT